MTGTSDLQRGSERIREAGVDLVVVTRGEHGCYFNDGSTQGFLDGFQVDVVDPLGAGDGFVAAMLAKLMQTFDAGRAAVRLDEGPTSRHHDLCECGGRIEHTACGVYSGTTVGVGGLRRF